jgi:tetratricopeptide (TPR) repeat protein
VLPRWRIVGETMMANFKGRPGRWMAATLVVVALGIVAPVCAAEDESNLRERALKLNDITGDNVIRGQLLSLLDDVPGTKKLVAAAAKMVNGMDQPFDLNATYILATAARGVKDVESSEKFYRLHAEQAKKLDNSQKMVNAYASLSDLFLENKKYAECEKISQELLELLGDRAPLMFCERVALAMVRQGHFDEASKFANGIIRKTKGKWRAVGILGLVQREAGQSEEAAKTYEKILEDVKKEKGIKKDELKEYTHRYRYILSGVYMDLDNVDKAAEHLKALLADDPDNPTYNNDLGYIWADHDMNLDESEKMIRKALDEDRKQRRKDDPEIKPEDDKDNAAYLDSLAWVLFRKKKFKEALPLLEQAIKEEEGRHIEIFDHLAQVHVALGEKAKAIDAWKKGLEVAGTSKREQQRKQDVEKKIKDNE